MRSQVAFELSKEDGEQELQAFMEFGQHMQRSSSSAASASGDQLVAAAAKVKVEEPTASEIMADKVEELKATKDQSLQLMQTINLEVRTV